MKNLLIILIFASCTIPALAQDDVLVRLGEAKNSYSSGDLENARYALQQSLAELDMLICREVLAVLPTEVAGLPYLPSDDAVSGNAAIIGSSVQRNYQLDERYINLTLMNNSPMLSMVTAFLTNPLFASTSDGSQKQVKIAGYKSVLQKNEVETDDSFTIQVPLNESLLTLEFNQFTEQEALAAAERMNITEIVNILN